jgi:uncharacterized RmlC-like cupin family protein
MGKEPFIVQGASAPVAAGPPTPGMDRHQLYDVDDRWMGWVRTVAGLAGGWHHHGDRESYVYVVRGRVRIEYGSGGVLFVEGVAGDFIYNPPHLVHREVTGPEEPAEVFVIRIGPGPLNVNVDGPDSPVA